MTINADGASSEIILQQNGTEIGRIGSGFAGTSGQVLTSNGAGAAPTMQAGGKVLQVVEGTPLTTDVITTSMTWGDTGLTLSITPTASSSKILVEYDISAHMPTGSYVNGGAFRFVRDGTALFTPTDLEVTTNNLRADMRPHNSYYDSPSTTSSVTYKVQFRSYYTGRTLQITGGNRSIIRAMEIGA